MQQIKWLDKLWFLVIPTFFFLIYSLLLVLSHCYRRRLATNQTILLIGIAAFSVLYNCDENTELLTQVFQPLLTPSVYTSRFWILDYMNTPAFQFDLLPGNVIYDAHFLSLQM